MVPVVFILPIVGLAVVAIFLIAAPAAWQPIASITFQVYVIIILGWGLWRLTTLLWINRAVFRRHWRGRHRRAWETYLRALFDDYANSYDQHLRQRLNYVGPERLGELLETRLAKSATRDIADLGCGTGLCGDVLRPYARHLVGVDLSAEMIAKARQTGCYDQLEVSDLLSFLIEHPRSFDGLTAMDILPYFEELDYVLNACQTALRQGGWLVITTESKDVPRAKPSSMRFAHSRDEIRLIANKAGFQISADKQIVLREEADKPMIGDIYFLEKR